VGRNNWVFFGSDEDGKTAAVLRSFVASCQRVRVDPLVWLKDILTRIADHPITGLPSCCRTTGRPLRPDPKTPNYTGKRFGARSSW
jgi:hypothetical protein